MVRASLLAATALLLSVTASAQQVANTFELSAGARWSDNVAHVADAQSGTVGTLGVLLKADRKTGALQYKSNGDLDYLHYVNQSYSNEVLGQFTGSAAYSIVPQSLEWVLDEHFGQVTTDYFQAPGPQNRQYQNLFSTGPDVRLRLANALQLRVSARFGRDDYQSSPYSATRLSGEGALERRPSAAVLLSLGAGHERVDYLVDAAKPGNFAVNRYFVGYALDGARTRIDIQGGYAESSGGLTQLSGPVGHFDIDRQIGSSGHLNLDIRRTLDTVSPGSRTSDSLPGAGNEAGAEVLTGSLYFSDLAQVVYRWQRPRDTLDMGVAFAKETDHQNIRPDRDIQSLGTKYSHRLTPLADAGAYASWSRDTVYNAVYPGYPQGDFQSTDTRFGLLFRMRFSRVLVTLLDLTHVNRVATIGPYRENAAWLRLAYAPLARGAATDDAAQAAPQAAPR